LADTGPRALGALLVSAIIPAYNHGAYIGATLASVLAQRYPHVEAIVVDDGSTDDTAQRIMEFQGRVIYHRQGNRGMAAARNQGIALAQGQLISFLDDDDLWEPDYLATVVPVFAADPDAAAVYTGFKSLDAAGQVLPQGGTRVVAPERLYDALVDGGFFPACCLTVRKAVLDEIGGLDETLHGNDDWDLLLRLACDRRVIGLTDPLAIHREHTGGLRSGISSRATWTWAAGGSTAPSRSVPPLRNASAPGTISRAAINPRGGAATPSVSTCCGASAL
jgi:glycosyltransferase involved in cell wall biosynthesis